MMHNLSLLSQIINKNDHYAKEYVWIKLRIVVWESAECRKIENKYIEQNMLKYFYRLFCVFSVLPIMKNLFMIQLIYSLKG